MNTCLMRIAKFLLLSLVCHTCCPAAWSEPLPRERLNMDAGWRFHLGDEWGAGHGLAKAASGIGPASVAYSDASWRVVDLPHDWAVELPFDPNADGAHGFKPLGPGFKQNSVGWYRKVFDLPASDAGRRIWIEFDGVFRDCSVFVNGWLVGNQESGYNSFRFDISDVVKPGGRNVVAVRVDASQFEGWFYEGAGIYRHVWLTKTHELALAPDGIFVYSRFPDNTPIGAASADVCIEARLQNTGKERSVATVQWTVVDPGGESVATGTGSAEIGPASSADLRATVSVPAPVLWSPETPRLYQLVTTVEVMGEMTDRVATEFGIRTVAFDADRGFLLNGRPYLIKGTCNHQDHAGVGAALPDRLQYFRIAKLKEMGSNAYRPSHNPPTPELLEACDRLGMLVMDECRRLGSDARGLELLAGLVRRDRNHPSVFIWCLANEEFWAQRTEQGARVATTMQRTIKAIDPTRPVTYAAPFGNEFVGINPVIEVRGWNYSLGEGTDVYHREHPNQPNLITETASTVGTRGIYANDRARGYVSAYDDNAPEWGQSAEAWWSFLDARPWLSGAFVWTGFDYRGEPTPYGWPCISSHFGILDTCGFPKDNFWYYRSWWTEDPVLHLVPHWNWPGREGMPIDVRALSNCEEVELFLNGRSLGRQALPRNSQLKWKVDYAPGTLAALGYRGGKVVASTAKVTTGAPAAIHLVADRPSIRADGDDVAIVTVSVVDAQGRVVPDARDRMTFALEGPGRIIGVGNGDPSCHEPDVVFAPITMRTAPVDGWRWARVPTAYVPDIPELGAQFDDSSWQETDARGERDPLGPGEHGVLRARFVVSAEDLESPAVELWFGRINRTDGFVFVNGQKIGSAGDPATPSIYEIKSLLHPGENTVALALANYSNDATAGLRGGVMLRMPQPPAPVDWQRSAFNGLAQVIVQAWPSEGVLRLSARAEGLETGTLQIETVRSAMAARVP